MLPGAVSVSQMLATYLIEIIYIDIDIIITVTVIAAVMIPVIIVMMVIPVVVPVNIAEDGVGCCYPQAKA